MEIIKKPYISDKEKQKAFFFENVKKGDKINVSKTAESLGVSRPTIYSWIKEIEESE